MLNHKGNEWGVNNRKQTNPAGSNIKHENKSETHQLKQIHLKVIMQYLNHFKTN